MTFSHVSVAAAGLTVLIFASSSDSFVFTATQRRRSLLSSQTMSADDKNELSDNDKELPVSGSFFNIVPPKSDMTPYQSEELGSIIDDFASIKPFGGDDIDMFKEIIKRTQMNRKEGGMGFSKITTTSDYVSSSIIQTRSTDASGKQQSFVGIGKPLNDVRNPEYDQDGYTLYADETTGEKKRVFEALVEYPSVFKMKIVGQDDENESFVPEIVQVVAESCGVEVGDVEHSKRKNGKWTSVTVHAPVKSADMLYALYENVDKDPRVKFKF